VQPIIELSSAAGLCAGRGCALIRQLATNHKYSRRAEIDKMASKMQDPESYNRIFILGAKNCTEDSLRDVFSKYGVVLDVYFVKDRRTDERKGSCV